MEQLGNLGQKIEEAEFGDRRLNKRLSRLCEEMNESTSTSVAEMLSDPNQTKAYYRFVNNRKVEADKLIDIFRAHSEDLAQDYPVLLAIQDTTELDYTRNRARQGLGCLDHSERKGFYLHNHLLVSPEGLIISLFSQLFFNRRPEGLGQTDQRKHWPIEQKESYRWLKEFNLLQERFGGNPEQIVINIDDSEADIGEVLGARHQENVHYIIRGRVSRKSAESEQKTWGQVAQAPRRFSYQVQVNLKNGPTRKAHLSVRYRKVVIKAPYRQGKQLADQPLWIVETKEENPPEGHKGICWRLLTSLEVEGDEQARRVIGYYMLRWLIERFHYVLKQCRKVEDLQIKREGALKNAIILQSWISVKVCNMAYLSRVAPQKDLQGAGFSEQDYLIAYTYLKKKHKNLSKASKPCLGDFARLMARLGGSNLQKDRPLGVIALWKGFSKFLDIREGYLLAKSVLVGNR